MPSAIMESHLKKNGISLSWHFTKAYSTALLSNFICLALSLKGHFPEVDVDDDHALSLWLLFRHEYKPPDIPAWTILLALSRVVGMSVDELTELEVPWTLDTVEWETSLSMVYWMGVSLASKKHQFHIDYPVLLEQPKKLT